MAYSVNKVILVETSTPKAKTFQSGDRVITSIAKWELER